MSVAVGRWGKNQPSKTTSVQSRVSDWQSTSSKTYAVQPPMYLHRINGINRIDQPSNTPSASNNKDTQNRRFSAPRNLDIITLSLGQFLNSEAPQPRQPRHVARTTSSTGSCVWYCEDVHLLVYSLFGPLQEDVPGRSGGDRRHGWPRAGQVGRVRPCRDGRLDHRVHLSHQMTRKFSSCNKYH